MGAPISTRGSTPHPTPGSRPDCRLALFADPGIGFAPPLVAAAVAAAPAAGVTVAAIVDTAPVPRGAPRALARRAAGIALGSLFGDPPPGRPRPRFGAPLDLARVARRHAIPLVVPPARDLSHPRLGERLFDDLGVTAALSLGCLQRFRRPLLDRLATAVNFHDGLLPDYRGLAATSWSVYRGEAASGFTFHHVSERLDGGDVLLQEALPVGPDTSVHALLVAKTGRAAARLGEVLAAIAEGRPGRRQEDGGSYFGSREREAIVRVGDPGTLDWADLGRRLHAFDRVFLDLAGRTWEVTAVRRVEGRGGPLAFTSRDGVRGEPVRFLHLPRPLYRLVRPAFAVPAR
ncbi:MAG TPA: formyltransferase family protein [Thermoanaerobaculia bacterium]